MTDSPPLRSRPSTGLRRRDVEDEMPVIRATKMSIVAQRPRLRFTTASESSDALSVESSVASLVVLLGDLALDRGPGDADLDVVVDLEPEAVASTPVMKP
jgi:hypothetical protein